MPNKADKAVVVKLHFTLSDSQGVMYDTTHEWNNMPLAGAVYIEQEFLQVLSQLQEWGKASVKGEPLEFPWR